jgi:hypothetical protein
MPRSTCNPADGVRRCEVKSYGWERVTFVSYHGLGSDIRLHDGVVEAGRKSMMMSQLLTSDVPGPAWA